MSQELDNGDSGAGTARTMVTIVATLTGVSAMFVAARLFVRIKLRSLGLDDYLIVLAMVTIMGHNFPYTSRDLLTTPTDLCLCQLRHLQCSGSIRQRSTFRYSESRGQAKCHQVYHGRFLSRRSLLCDSQTRSSGLVEQALEPKSGASNIPVVFHVGDRDRHIRVRHHLVCAVHAFAFTVGLFGRGQVLVTMDAGELLHLCRR
jgi:hypothetical protein